MKYLVEVFHLAIERDKIFEFMKCDVDSSAYEEMYKIFNKINQYVYDLISPKGIFTILPHSNSSSSVDIVGLSNSKVAAAVTLGNAITDKIQSLFDEDEYLEAMMLDVISDELIFLMSNKLYDIIVHVCNNMDLCLGRRVTPGDFEVPFSYQHELYENLNAGYYLSMDITEYFMLKPVKSLMYSYEISNEVSKGTGKHNCEDCDAKSCAYGTKSKIQIFVDHGGESNVIDHVPSQSLLESILEHVDIASPCGGSGTCGKCKIIDLENKLPVTELDRNKLTPEEIGYGYRLSCSAYPDQNCSIKIPGWIERKSDILTAYVQRGHEVNPWIKSIAVDVSCKPDNCNDMVERINGSTRFHWRYSLNALSNLSSIMSKNRNLETIYLHTRNDEVLDVTEKPDSSFGVVIDVGTTTVVIGVVDLNTGKNVETYSVLNSQKIYGSDVVSRIRYASENEKNLSILSNLVRKDIVQGLNYMITQLKIDRRSIRDVVISGNSTMLHILMGLQCKTIGEAPFLSVSLNRHTFDFHHIFKDAPFHAKVSFMPGVAAYVGSDIVMGILNCCMDLNDEIVLLIDIGTNGEMAIGNKNRILSLATAAGPAFEGANISSGTGCVSGAINSIYLKNKEIKFTTIGNCAPIGICGSGVVDLVDVALSSGIVDENGHIERREYADGIVLATLADQQKIVFTQKDFREVQLAKAAIRTGIDILIDRYGCSYTEISRVYIAGGFGNRMNILSAVGIGLIPEALKEVIVPVGNSALGGTVDYILNKENDKRINAIIDLVQYMDISLDKQFSERFIENIIF